MAMMTQMEIEARQSPQAVVQLLSSNQDTLNALRDRLMRAPANFALTIARGSSDHAATFAKYLLETQLGLVTASAAPSVQTIYKSKLKLKSALVIGISQSGKSEDICTTMKMARENGAITVALVNKLESPLAEIVEFVLDVSAGVELAVAATKSYICSLALLAQLTAKLADNRTLEQALNRLPENLNLALDMDWSPILDNFNHAQNTIVIGRGYSYPIAQESALKFKETCGIHAEPFSSAEFIHGPLALVKDNFPMICYGQDDESYTSVLDLVKRAKTLGAQTLLAAPKNLKYHDEADIYLPLPNSLNPICDPIIAIQAFYPTIAKLSVQLGRNPDKPQNLLKETSTK